MPRELTGTTEPKHYGARLTVKAADEGEPAGRFSALAAVFNNIDSHGDRMIKGCFQRTLVERGYPKLVWSHDRLTPPIGVVENAQETDQGLLIDGRLFVDQEAGEDHPIARQVYTAMKTAGGDGRPGLADFSFGCRVKGAQWAEVDPDTLDPDLQWTGGQIRDITDVTLWEIGPCLVGANDQAGLVTVKSLAAVFGVSEGQVRSAFAAPEPDPDGDADEAAGPVSHTFSDRKHATRLAELLTKTPSPSPSKE